MKRVLRQERHNMRRPANWLAALALVAVATSLGSTSFAQPPKNEAAAPATATAPVAPPASGAPAAGGQSPTGSFAGLSKNSDEPIDIESDVLLVHDSQKTATFKGNVKAVQGSTILQSKELEVHYAGGGGESLTGTPGAKPGTVASADPKPQPAKPASGDKSGVALGDNGTKITKIYAKGDVVINSDQEQTTTSDWAIYDVPGKTVTVGGNVVLTQGKNVLKGDRLVIDLTTGESRFDNSGNAVAGKQRIKALFMPKQDAGSNDDGSSKDKPSGEKTGSAAPNDETSGATKGAAGEPAAAATASQGQPAPDQPVVKDAPAKAPQQDDASPWQLVPGNMQ